MSLYRQQSSNIAKTWLLFGFFLSFLIALGWAVSYIYNDPGIMYLAIVLALAMNVLSYWFSDKLVLGMAGAKPANRKEYFDLYTTVENLSITAGLPMPKVYVIEDPAPNAFATGRNEKHAVVAVTTGLLKMLEKTELEGVIAHELAHIGNKDMLVSTIAVVMAGFASLLADFFLRASFFGGRDDDSRGNAIFAVVGFVLIMLAPVAAMMIQLAISRRREFLADATGALLTRYPEGLASALRKIGSYNAPVARASNATAHLYISNPFGAKALQGMHKLFMTHPPIEERIKALSSIKV
ncbi:MAG TPA: zinc metalloprotease HtpX [Candidatus Paceibacterota bacterium]|nr:zinc metalloprotease HtpX [Candidatus Paceibacterota bacterium]